MDICIGILWLFRIFWVWLWCTYNLFGCCWEKVPEFSPDFRSKIETRLVDLCIGVLNDFVPSLQQSKTHANKLKVNLVENILIELRDSFSLELFQASLPRLFEPLMNLIPCGEPQITEPLSRLLTIRLRPLLNLEKPTWFFIRTQFCNAHCSKFSARIQEETFKAIGKF